MTDFDEVLERLLTDPAFKTALAANPQAALAGYRLDDSEREILGAQLVSGEGEQRTVETRTSKSGVFGLVGPVAAALGAAATGGGSGLAGAPSGALSGSQALGDAPGSDTFGHVPVQGSESFGSADDAGSGGGTETLGRVGSTEGIGSATQVSASGGSAPVEATGYHTHVDVDGDGRWDAYTAYQRSDGGVDIVADADHDGRVDFIGHDYNRDGLVDVAEFDNDGDGTLETRMYDDTGDGWMDRQERVTDDSPVQGFGSAPHS